MKNEAVMIADILPDNDKFASVRELRDDMYCSQGGLCKWLRYFLDNSHHHSVTAEGLNHLKKLLHENQPKLSFCMSLFIISIVAMVIMLS